MIVYPAEILERRAQEEMVRSDKHHTYFVYAEIDFNHLDQHILHESDQELFITILLQVLNSDIRSTDILGLLPNNQGFVVLMPEAKEKAWFRIRRSFGENFRIVQICIKFLKNKSILLFIRFVCQKNHENSCRWFRLSKI